MSDTEEDGGLGQPSSEGSVRYISRFSLYGTVASCRLEQESPDSAFYGFLNVSRTASQEEVTAAYKRLARLYHPDKHQVDVKLLCWGEACGG